MMLILKGGVADFEVGMRIWGTHRVSIILKTIRPRSPVVRKTPLFPLGKPPKRQPSPSARTPIDRAKVMFEDLTLFFSASKKDITLYLYDKPLKS